MTSQSGTIYQIIVTVCLTLGVTHLSQGSSVASEREVVPPSLSHISYNYNLRYPPSGPTGLFFTAGDIAAAESGPLFGDGALAAHPLHSLVPTGMDLLNIGGGNQFIRSIASDDLQASGQSYFIEPPTTSTTTQKPVFKKRRTKRPISSLAEQSKKSKAAVVAADGNNANNEVLQGNPVPFNPFRQIVNTSFGRKRPSDNIKQERTRSRANVANSETGSATAGGVTNNARKQKNIDGLNEIPSKTEGEPRVLGRRRPAQDVRPLRPTTTAANEQSNSNADETPKGRRVVLRKPRPNLEGSTASVNEGADNANASGKSLRPRPLAKRPRPRPTTTIAALATDTDPPTETTDPATVSHFQPLTSPQTPPPALVPVTEARPRVRPVRPPGVSRFANANRNTVTTSPVSSDESPVPSLPPASRRRPLRPTTRPQSLTTSTEAPEDILGNSVRDENTSAPGSGRGRADGAQKAGREGRQGFLLRPRPTPNVASKASETAPVTPTELNEEGIRRPLSNRRRKKPTTTVASPVSPPITYNQNFVGGVVESNVVPRGPSNERLTSARRANPSLRSRATPSSGPSAYQIKEEQPVPEQVGAQQGNFGNTNPGSFLVNQPRPLTQIGGPTFQSFRRPTAPSAPSAVAPSPSQFQHPFNSNSGLVDPNNFVNADPNFFQIPNQPSFYPGGFDNSLGVPSNLNLRSIQQLPGANEFSSRSTSTSGEPEISHSDFSPSAPSDKQSVSSSNIEIEAAPASDGGEQEAVKEETEQTTKAPAPLKLSPLERLQQNRQAAARRLLAPRKPTEKTTVAPKPLNGKPGNNLRKSFVPPRMLRTRGKLPGAPTVPVEEKSVPNDGGENISGEVKEKLNKEADSNSVVGNTNGGTASAIETDKETNIIPISPNPAEEEKEVSTRKPTILEAAKRRRVSPLLSKNNVAAPQQQPKQKPKITPAPPPSHDPGAAPPTCEDGQRYSKFLKRCVTMYKPKTQG